MEVIGKFVKTLPEQTGVGKNGEWVNAGFVVETSEQYPKNLAFSARKDDVVEVVRELSIGDMIKVFFSAESREYNERWYTELKAFRIDKLV